MVDALGVADIVNGVAIVLAAGLILAKGAPSRVKRWLVAFLLFRGMENVLFAFRGAGQIPFGLSSVFTSGLPGMWLLLAVVFAATYRDPKWNRWLWPALFVGVTYLLLSSPGIRYTWTEGPQVRPLVNESMAWFHDASRLAASLLVAHVAAHHTRETVRRAGLLLAAGLVSFSAGFAGRGIFLGPLCALNRERECAELSTEAWVGFALDTVIQGALLVAFIALLWRHAPGLARWVLALVCIGFAGNVASIVEADLRGLEAYGDTGSYQVFLWTTKALVFVQPVLLGYGILRYQILGLDLKLKRTVKASTIAAAFIGMFVLASQVAGAFLEDQVGSSVVGVLATGSLLVLIVPIRKLAERVAGAAAPHAKPVGAMDGDGRLEVYSQQLEFAWADGGISKPERLRLEHLRDKLGIAAEAALAAEKRVAAS